MKEIEKIRVEARLLHENNRSLCKEIARLRADNRIMKEALEIISLKQSHTKIQRNEYFIKLGKDTLAKVGK